MNNKGQVTVFLSLMSCALILMGLLGIKVCKYFTAKTKAVIAVNSAVSDVKSRYNSYIYEHYHILLFDKTDYGKGEAAVEEFMYDNVKENLDDYLEIRSFAITDFNVITDNNCEALKEQINDYTVYAAVNYGADEIMSKTGRQEAVIDEKIIDSMDAETDVEYSAHDLENIEFKKEEDPRKITKTFGKIGIVNYVAPKDLEISTEIIDISECPSKYTFEIPDIYDLNGEFNSYSKLKKNLRNKTSWNNALVDAGCGLAYAKNVFNCAVDCDKNDDTVFKFEIEYIICGKTSDYNNLKATINKILAIRFPMNYQYLLTDVSKMSRVEEIALALSIPTAIPEPILKYLIAGCWSYAESVSDLKILLKGNKVPFEKDKASWKTDIDHLSESINEDSDEGTGMTYEDYLMILMAVNMNTSYQRMLDIIQLNTRQIYPDFLMVNAAVGLSVDASISYEENIFDFHISGGY